MVDESEDEEEEDEIEDENDRLKPSTSNADSDYDFDEIDTENKPQVENLTSKCKTAEPAKKTQKRKLKVRIMAQVDKNIKEQTNNIQHAVIKLLLTISSFLFSYFILSSLCIHFCYVYFVSFYNLLMLLNYVKTVWSLDVKVYLVSILNSDFVLFFRHSTRSQRKQKLKK